MNVKKRGSGSLVVLVVMCAVLLGTGGTHTQGTYVCGEHLDWRNADGGVYEGGICRSQTAGNLSSNTFTFKGYLPTNGAEADVKVNCSAAPTGNPYLRECRIPRVQTTPDMKFVCGRKRRAVVLQAVQDGGTLDFTSSAAATNVVLACSGEEHTPDSRGVGAIGRCLKWFQAPLGPKETDEFLACLRMARADYCGCGDSRTHVGAWIHVGYNDDDLDETDLKPSCREAGWIPRGASCINRSRIGVIVAAYNLRFQSRDGQRTQTTAVTDKRSNVAPASPTPLELCMQQCTARLKELDANPQLLITDGGIPASSCELSGANKGLFMNMSRTNPVDPDQPEKADCP